MTSKYHCGELRRIFAFLVCLMYLACAAQSQVSARPVDPGECARIEHEIRQLQDALAMLSKSLQTLQSEFDAVNQKLQVVTQDADIQQVALQEGGKPSAAAMESLRQIKGVAQALLSMRDVFNAQIQALKQDIVTTQSAIDELLKELAAYGCSMREMRARPIIHN